MPFWQENRKFLIRVGGALAIVLIGFTIVMNLYDSAADKNRRNVDLATRIEILSNELGEPERVEEGRRVELARRWNEVRSAVAQTIQAKFIFEDDKTVRLLWEVDTVGGAWKERFEKKNMVVDDSVANFGDLATSKVNAEVDEKIARLDMLDRVMAVVDEVGIAGIGGVRHEQRRIISIPGSDRAIVRLSVKVQVDGGFSEVSAFIRKLQETGSYIQVALAELKPGDQQPVHADLVLAALQVHERSSLEGETGRRGRSRRSPSRDR
ncbi:MAG: hypothetical protein O7H41_01075 [Planctomycetota bacterium]|nr:hypothetical protein [Planctomycetota bacterium]